ncbi:hypothetical protein [Halioxenophilus aromaticivorans]|uniref:hypothetical protein n=1 Tax=Halioxenophilus aromaticivorans TaxID=1306992 RepID=UPI0031EE7E98
MVDKSWMLNASAIRAAKQCVSVVKDEMGIKLLLSNPEFYFLLQEYVDLTQSQRLAEAFKKLQQYADPNIAKAAQRRQAKDDNVSGESVTVSGKTYARFRGSKEFSGLYRGQPVYR